MRRGGYRWCGCVRLVRWLWAVGALCTFGFRSNCITQTLSNDLRRTDYAIDAKRVLPTGPSSRIAQAPTDLSSYQADPSILQWATNTHPYFRLGATTVHTAWSAAKTSPRVQSLKSGHIEVTSDNETWPLYMDRP